MSTNPNIELEEFLASLPVYKRKEFQQGLSSLTQDEMNEYIRHAEDPQSGTLAREHERLLQRIPVKLREYRDREINAFAQLRASTLPPANPEGRPRKDALADEADRLRKLDLSYAQVAKRLNQEGHSRGLLSSEETLTGEQIRGLLRYRRLKFLRTAPHPDKT